MAKRGLVKVLGRGELTKALTVRAHGFSQARGRRDRGCGRDGVEVHPGAVGRRPSAGPRERPHQPLGTLADTPTSTGGRRPHVWALPPAEHVPGRPTSGTRSSSRSSSSSIYRLGSHIPVPYVDFSAIKELQNDAESNGGVVGFLDLFSGGAITNVAVFFLGIMPYITASIIMQLLGVVIPKLEQWQQEGQIGQKKITQWTRYLTVALALMQSTGFVFALKSGNGGLLGFVRLPEGHGPDPGLHAVARPRSSSSRGPPVPRSSCGSASSSPSAASATACRS